MKKYLIMWVLVLLMGVPIACEALPQPLGELNKEMTLSRFFKDKNIDMVEGIWSTSDNRYEFAIVKNTSGTLTEYDYVGIVVGGTGDCWKKGEVKALLKKTSTMDTYTGIYYQEESNGIWGNSKKEYGTMFSLSGNNLLTCSLPTGLYGLPNRYSFLRTYPAYDATSVSLVQSGTGFFITDRIVVTNYHVIANAKEVEVTFKNEFKQKATILAKDAANDIALLQVEGLENQVTPPAFGNAKDIQEGERAFTVGFPLVNELGARARISEGLVNSLAGANDDFRMIQISIPIQPGNSGSPVFNEKGQVIGIVTAMLNDSYFLAKRGVVPQNVGFAIKSNYIGNLLSALPTGNIVSTTPLANGLNSVQIMEVAKQSVVLITAKK